MSAILAVVGSVLGVFTSPLVQTLLFILAVFITMTLFVVGSVFIAYALAILWAGRQTGFKKKSSETSAGAAIARSPAIVEPLSGSAEQQIVSSKANGNGGGDASSAAAPTGADTKPDTGEGFDERRLVSPITSAALAAWATVASVFSGLLNTLRASAMALLDNWQLLLLALLLIGPILLYIEYYNELIEVANRVWNGFFGIFIRPLILPLVNTLALLGSALLPLLNMVSRVTKVLTTTALLRALTCAFGVVTQVLLLLGESFASGALATALWFTPTPGAGLSSAFVIGPNYTDAGVKFGSAVVALRGVLTCSCESADPLFYAPLVQPFGTPAFAYGYNATFALIPVFLTQGVLAPIAFTVNNSASSPGAPFADVFFRPSFNSTIDTARFAITNLTRVADTWWPAFYTAWRNELASLVGFTLPEAAPPDQSWFTLLLAAPLDVFILSPAELAFNFLWNIDKVFGTLNGAQYFNLDLIFARLLYYVNVIVGGTNWLVLWLQELSVILGNELPVPIGPALGVGVSVLANFVNVSSCTVSTGSLAVVSSASLITDLPPGVVYGFAQSAVASGHPNPLSFLQTTWGDKPRTWSCEITNVGNVMNSQVRAFTGNVTTCTDELRFNITCSVVAANGTIPANVTQIVGYEPDLGNAATIAVCNGQTSEPCGTAIDSIANGLRGVNRYQQSLTLYVELGVCVASVFDVLCNDPSCKIAGNFTRALGTAVVDAVLIPIDIAVHIDLVFTTVYLAMCVEWQQLITAFESAVRVLSNTIRLTGNGLEDMTVCPLVPDFPNAHSQQPSDDLFCATADLFDSGAAIIIEPSRQIVLGAQILVLEIASVTAGGTGQTVSNLFSKLSLEDTDQALRNTTRNALTLPFQGIPGDLMCDLPSNFSWRSVVINVTSTIAADILLLIPTTFLNTSLTVVQVIGEAQPIDVALPRITAAIILPTVTTFADVFDQAGNFVQCISFNDTTASALHDVAAFLYSIGESVIKAVTLFFLLIIQLVGGFFQLIASGGHDFTLLKAALSTGVTFIVDLFILIFGTGFMCGLQDSLCFFAPPDSVDFAISECIAQNYTFHFCGLAERPSGIQCSVDNTGCVFGLCPDFPLGCCSTVPFPPIGGPTANLTAGDSRKQCSFVVTPTFTYEPFNITTLHASYGQPADPTCNVFQNNSVCVNIVYLDPVTGLPVSRRKRQTKPAPMSNAQCLVFLLARSDVVRQLERRKPNTADEMDVEACMTQLGQEPEPSNFDKLADQMRVAVASIGDHWQARANEYHLAVRDMYHARKRGVPIETTSSLVLFSELSLHLYDRFQNNEPWSTKNLRRVPRREQRPLALAAAASSQSQRKQVDWRLMGEFFSHTQTHISAKLGERLSAVLNPPQRKPLAGTPTTRRAAGLKMLFSGDPKYALQRMPRLRAGSAHIMPFAVNQLPDALLPSLGIEPCDPSKQFVCTNCTYFNDFVFAVQDSLNHLSSFYGGTSNASFSGLTRRYARSIDLTLVDPLGTDTYLTSPRTIPFILDQLSDVLWPGLWNYTTFFEIIGDNGDCGFNITASLDAYPLLQSAVTKIMGSFLNTLNRIICAVLVKPAEIASALWETYLVCDYDNALYGTSSIGIGLFSGFVVTAVILGLVALALTPIPGAGTCLLMIYAIALIAVTPWLAYGASPLCLIPASFTNAPAIPVPLPMDAYAQLEMLLPPALPYPICLIKPEARAQAGAQLVAQNLPPPPTQDCAAAANFTSPFDPLFFITTSLFGENFTLSISEGLAGVAPNASATAAKYTDAYLAELKANDNCGVVCTALTSPELLLTLVALVLSLAIVTAVVVALVPVFFFAMVFIFTLLVLMFELLDQADSGFVEDDRVESMSPLAATPT